MMMYSKGDIIELREAGHAIVLEVLNKRQFVKRYCWPLEEIECFWPAYRTRGPIYISHVRQQVDFVTTTLHFFCYLLIGDKKGWASDREVSNMKEPYAVQ